MRLSLTAKNGKSMEAEVIHVFTREDEPVADFAPTFHVMAQVIFRTVAQASRVLLLHSRGGALFFVMEVAHRWFDVKAEEIGVKVSERV